jgi:glycosyltransferase involved in cell wall biosynthesis
MRVLVTTHAQMFKTPDGKVWTKSVYGYDFFKRYLDVFENVRIVTRMKRIDFEEVGDKILVSGPNIEFHSLPFYHGPWQYATKLLQIKKALGNAIYNCDCAILRIPDQLAFQLFNKVKKHDIPCGVEVVSDSWDLFAPGTIKTILRPFLRILWSYLQKRTCMKADGVAYVTEKYIQKRYPARINQSDNKRFETSYTSADLDSKFFYRPRQFNDFDKDALTLVHVSGINNSAKGHFELLKALAELKERSVYLNLIFVGGGTMLNYYQVLSEQLGVLDQVTFTGHVSRMEDIVEILKKSDVFVFPTMTEGLPRVIIEAMAAGLPCIATNVGGISELLSDRSIIHSNNIKLLCDKIIEFINDNKLLQEESRRNFEKAKYYSREAVQAKRNEFYSELRSLTKCNYSL